MGGGSQTTVQQADPWGPSQPYLEGAMSDAEQLYQGGGFAPDPYNAPRVTPFSDTTMTGLGATAYQASLGAPGVQQAGTTLTSMMNPQAQEARLSAVKDDALGSAIPAAIAPFAGSGMTNSTLAMDTVGRAATQAVAPYDYSAYQAEQGRALQAAGMAPQIEQAGYLAPLMLTGVGQQMDAQTQALIDANMGQYYEGENQAMDALNNYSSLLLGYGGQGGSSSSTASDSPGAGEIIGTGLQAASMIPLLFSDRRLKRNIQKIGKTPGGHNLYAYNYLWSDAPQYGVMADEVPEAIAGYANGFAVVDYGRVS